MKLVELSDKLILDIGQIAFYSFKNDSTNSYNFRLECIIKATIKYFECNNITIKDGKLYTSDKQKYELEIKELYDKLDNQLKYKYIMNVEKLQLLHEIQMLKEENNKLKEKEKNENES